MKNRQPPDSRHRDPDSDSDRDPGHDHTPFTVRDVVATYNTNAPTLAPQYEDLPFEQVHASILDLLPDAGACILDMGAGTGRDAAWFAANGYSVVAAEPAAGMRNAGKALHSSPDIRWMDDALPAPEKVLRSKPAFDLIWLSAVWMHEPPGARAQAFRKLVSVMSPGGSMMLTLRQGPPPAEHPMEPATAADVEALARRHGLQTVRSERVPDFLGRDGIAWEVIWLRLPDDGAGANARMLKALALAKLGYVESVLGICARFGCRAFASIVETDAQPTAGGGLRKDYAYLFERFFYFLQDNRTEEQGVVVFDELEKSKSHLLIDQMHRYFRDTAVGRLRANRIVPEPFFVHSELTTGVQIADLVAYVISWGFRMARMTKPAREELSPFANQIAGLRYRAVRQRMGNPEFEIWSFAHITDLRTQAERDEEE